MYNESFDDYIRSVLGYPNMSFQNDYQNFNASNYGTQSNYNNIELERYYPEIYKIVYPMIMKRCNSIRSNRITDEEIESMTDEIYNAVEDNNEIRLNINLENEVRTANSSGSSKEISKKPDVKISESSQEKRQTRQVNRGLRDLIKILLIRELLGRPGRPQTPRPPYGGMRPPRPPMPNPGGPIPRMPFNENDIFEY